MNGTTNETKSIGAASGLSDELGCVLTYEVLHVPGVHGQTVGADGTGVFAEVYLCDPEQAAEIATQRIRDMEGRKWKLGAVHLVQHGNVYGWAGSPVRIVVPNADVTGLPERSVGKSELT